jgi:HAMP domain-containing protein
VPRFLTTWSFRLTLLYAGLFTASVMLLFGVIYWSALDYAVQDETDEINVEFHAIVDEANLAGYAQLPKIIDNHLGQRAGTRVAYLLEDSSGRKIAGNIDALPPREGSMAVSLKSDERHRKLQAHFYRLPNGDFLLIGEDSFALNEMKELIARAFGTSAVATLLLAIIGGVIVSTSVLRRVESVARTSDAIIAGDLSQRVPVQGSEDAGPYRGPDA